MGRAGRLLMMGASDGPTNMGVDEALARLCRDHAVLRFYSWESSVLSIGYFQRAGEIDLAACRKSSICMVRRPTGGRAVLHQRDLTYSLILPLRLPWREFSIAESYRRINACLQRGLELLGISASMTIGLPHAPYPLSPFCFSTVARHEVVVGGKKVIGSAQRRFPTALLQQGTILLDVDPTSLSALLRPEKRATMEGSLDAIGSLREALGSLPDRQEVEAAIKEGFCREMGLEFVEGTLDREEVTLARQLAASRYASEDWTLRR
jgi:lipoate-protein ligase A